MRKTIVVLAAVLGIIPAAPCEVAAQTSRRPEILVLGTFHMANPGHDLHDAHVDDMLSERRQNEITRLMTVLREFRPTKIAVESDVGDVRVRKQYAGYLAGTYALSRNEIDQIGYRLAKELGDSVVYPVDESGDFPFYRVRNYAIANGEKAAFDSAQSAVEVRVKRENAYLESHTVLQMLELVNADSSVARAVGEYYTTYIPLGQPFEYAGPDLIASWFQRNLRIYHNIHALITSPNDRVLVIYGAGHLGWLRQIAASDPSVRLRRLGELPVPGAGTE